MTFAYFSEAITNLCEFKEDELLYQDVTIHDFFRTCEEHLGFQLPVQIGTNALMDDYRFILDSEKVTYYHDRVKDYFSNLVKDFLELGYTFH